MSVEDQTLDSVKKEIAAALQDRAQLPRATCQCCCNLLLLHRIQGLVLGQAHPRRILRFARKIVIRVRKCKQRLPLAALAPNIFVEPQVCQVVVLEVSSTFRTLNDLLTIRWSSL